MSKERIVQILDELFRDAMSHKPVPTYPKIGTIKAMADLGPGWHDYKAIQKELAKVQETGNVYTFYLARIHPELIEVDDQKRARISPEVYTIVKKTVTKYAESILLVKDQQSSK